MKNFSKWLKKRTQKNAKKNFTKKNLVQFGNYLLSEHRAQIISEANKNNVCDSDFDQWRNRVN